jgi:hypothetical protein
MANKQRGWRSWTWWPDNWKLAMFDWYAPQRVRSCVIKHSTLCLHVTTSYHSVVVLCDVLCLSSTQLWDRADDPCLLRLFGHTKSQVRLATLRLIHPDDKAFLEAYSDESYKKVPSLVGALSPQVTFSTHHQIWWMCINDCDARVRAVACRRLHVAYTYDAAIELHWQLPVIVLRLDKVRSFCPDCQQRLGGAVANFGLVSRSHRKQIPRRLCRSLCCWPTS